MPTSRARQCRSAHSTRPNTTSCAAVRPLTASRKMVGCRQYRAFGTPKRRGSTCANEDVEVLVTQNLTDDRLSGHPAATTKPGLIRLLTAPHAARSDMPFCSLKTCLCLAAEFVMEYTEDLYDSTERSRHECSLQHVRL